MSLDVHLIVEGDEQIKNWPLCQFEEPQHSAIFFGGKLEIQRYPMLAQMQDYYADARYAGDRLNDLLHELSEVLPMFSDEPKVYAILSCFEKACRDAALQRKTVLCLCD